MGLAYDAGLAWGRMGLPGKVTTFGLAGLLISLPYLNARYETLRGARSRAARTSRPMCG
jgi:hypothetical protein